MDFQELIAAAQAYARCAEYDQAMQALLGGLAIVLGWKATKFGAGLGWKLTKLLTSTAWSIARGIAGIFHHEPSELAKSLLYGMKGATAILNSPSVYDCVDTDDISICPDRKSIKVKGEEISKYLNLTDWPLVFGKARELINEAISAKNAAENRRICKTIYEARLQAFLERQSKRHAQDSTAFEFDSNLVNADAEAARCVNLSEVTHLAGCPVEHPRRSNDGKR